MKQNILLLILSMMIALLLGECVIRIFHLAPSLLSLDVNSPKSGYKRSDNPILGYELKANYRDNSPSLHKGNFPETNSHGQRDRERSYSKPSGVRRILLLGDSVVAGHGIWNLDNTISRQMELFLTPNAHIEVLNFGVGGYQTLAEAELLRTKGVKYAPDLVILVFDDSDFHQSNDDIMYYDSQLYNVAKILIKKFHLFRFIVLKFNIGNLRYRADLNYRINRHEEELSRSVETGIARIKHLAKQYKFDVFVVIWPRFSNASPKVPMIKDFCAVPGQYERLLLIESICRKYGMDTYRLADFFIKDYQKISESVYHQGKFSLSEIYTVDTCHPNEYGSGIAARAIIEILKRRSFLSHVQIKEEALWYMEKYTNPKKAIELLNQVIHSKPDFVQVYHERGIIYSELGQYQHAIEDFNKAIRLNRDYFGAYNQRGIIYSELGQYQQAIDDFSEAIRLNPDYVQAYNNRGSIYFITGNNELGCRDAQKVCTLANCGLLHFAKDHGYCQ